jgi:hypothetical protein
VPATRQAPCGAAMPGFSSARTMPGRAPQEPQSPPGPGRVRKARFTPQQEANSFQARGSIIFLLCSRLRYCAQNQFETCSSAMPGSQAHSLGSAARTPQARQSAPSPGGTPQASAARPRPRSGAPQAPAECRRPGSPHSKKQTLSRPEGQTTSSTALAPSTLRRTDLEHPALPCLVLTHTFAPAEHPFP